MAKEIKINDKVFKQKVANKHHQDRVAREHQQRRWLLIGVAVVAVLVVGLVAAGLLQEYVFKPMKAVAIVDNEKITVSDFEARARFQRHAIITSALQYAQIYQQFGMDPNAILEDADANLAAETLGNDTLDAMINEIVIEKEAIARGITVSDEEVEIALQEAFGFYANGTPVPTATATVFPTLTVGAQQLTIVAYTATPTTAPTATATAIPETPVPTATATATAVPPTATPEPTAPPEPTAGPSATPLPTATAYTLDVFENNYTNYIDEIKAFDFPEKDLRDMYRAKLYRDKMFELLTADVQPIQDQVWARHILVASQEEAQAVYDLLLAGGDWSELAMTYSSDTSNNTNGGDLGWFTRGAMVKPFEEAAFSQEVGTISQPVESEFGWHLIQVVGHEERPLTATELTQYREVVFGQWLEDVKTGLKIEKFPDVWMPAVPTTPTWADYQ